MMRRLAGPLLVSLVSAVLVHFAVLAAVPELIMRQVIANIARQSGVNAMVLIASATDARTVVRTTPDVLYSACAFDLSNGPVMVSAPTIKDGYSSLALYAQNTDNFFVENDQQSTAASIDVVVARIGQRPTTDAPIVYSPSVQGVALVRMIVTGGGDSAAAADARHQARCEPLATR